MSYYVIISNVIQMDFIWNKIQFAITDLDGGKLGKKYRCTFTQKAAMNCIL